MKLFRNIAVAAFVTIGAFSAVTYTACNSDKCKDVTCNNGGTCSDGNCKCLFTYSGSRCDTAIRSTFANKYKGTGSATDSTTYTNWSLSFGLSGTDATAMSLNLLDNNGASQLAFNVTLASATTYTLPSQTNGNYTYTGSGTISTTVATLTLNEKNNTTNATVVYTFNNMLKQ